MANKTAAADVRSESGGVPDDVRLLPSWFDNNIIALLPGEMTMMRLAKAAMQVGSHGVTLSGWNVKSASAVLPPPN